MKDDLDSLQMVQEFHETFDQPVHAWPNIKDRKLNELRLDLLFEELTELRTALDEGDEVGVLDALTDLQYVLDGAYLSLGYYPLKGEALEEVHSSNMSKLEDGKVIRRADGKVLKGKNYRPPCLETILINWKAVRADD
jgi:predicted HAD superfamily Cof-like phosphohydrolase